jgi:flagellar biosynthesis/type III secretory pathway chaperone
MFDLHNELTKLEILLSKEIEIYNVLIDTEEKKVLAIIATDLQDVNLYCEFQHKQMKRANELREIRERCIDLIVLNKFPHLADEATLAYIIKKIPLNKTARLASLRLELVTIMARLKQLNKLSPKLFEQALDVFGKVKDLLQESKKTGYDNRGKEHIVNKKLSLLINKSV